MPSDLFDFKADRPLSKIDGGVFIDPTIQKLGLTVGDKVTLTGAAGTVTLPVTGLYTNEGDQSFLVDWPQGLELVSTNRSSSRRSSASSDRPTLRQRRRR